MDRIVRFILLLIPVFKRLNTPPIDIPCRCGGVSISIKENNWGIHLFCCRCFVISIKPKIGLPYQKKDFTRHCQHPSKKERAAYAR